MLSFDHIADKITTHQVDFNIDYQHEFIELQAEDIMKDLINTPILTIGDLS